MRVVSTGVDDASLSRGSSAVLLGAALIAAWIAIALRRTKAAAPHWPWERTDEE